MTLRELRDAIDALGEDAAEYQPARLVLHWVNPNSLQWDWIADDVVLDVANHDLVDRAGNVLVSEGNPYLRRA